MPPKSQEISQIQTNEMNKLQQENQQLAAQFQTQVKKSSEQTIRRNKAENEELKNEERRRQKQKKKKKNSSGQSEDSEEEKTDAVPHFDMKV